MKNQNGIALAIAALGLVIGLVSLLADTIGIGTDQDSFGTLQILGTLAGVVILGAGIAYYYYGDRLLGGGVKSSS